MSEKADLAREVLQQLAPADFFDPVIEAYKKDVDRTLLCENLKLTVEERVRKAERTRQVHCTLSRRSPTGIAGRQRKRGNVIASLEEVLRTMQEHHVRCIVIGGWAAILHGAARTTNDVDLVYARDPENLKALAAALTSRQPYLRGAHRVCRSSGTNGQLRAGSISP